MAALTCALLGCSDDAADDEPEGSGTEVAKPSAGGAAAEKETGPLFTRSREMMGTVFRIAVARTPPEKAAPAVRSALDEIDRLETVLSEWLPDSEITRINEAAGDHPVEVSEDTLAVVKAGLDVSRWSDGAFDLSWAALKGLYDFRPKHRSIPGSKDVRERLSLIDHEAIVVDEEAQTVFLEREGMAIGTGGIAKGYALDRAGEILQKAGIEDFMLFGGGQVQVHGTRGNRPWRVGIQHPRQLDQYFAFLESSDGSISTSGDYERYFRDEDGKHWHHILDPRTGLPAPKSKSVTVLAASGLYADALSTAAFVLGPERASALFERIPYEAQLVMVDADCRLLVTEGTEKQLTFRMKLEEGRLPSCGQPLPRPR